MRRENDNQTLGIIIILIGLYFACKALGLVHFSIFFSGWWTLFIIIPSLISIRNEKSKSSGIVGVMIGFVFLACSQGWFSWSIIPGAAIAIFFILLGLRFILGDHKKFNGLGEEDQNRGGMNNGSQSQGGADTDYQNTNSTNTGYQYQNYSDVNFSYQNSNSAYTDDSSQNQGNAGFTNQASYENASQQTAYQGTSFQGATSHGTYTQQTQYSYQSNFETCPPNISAVLVGKSVSSLRGPFFGTKVQSILGNVQLDLRQAVIDRDATIDVSMVLGGVDIYLPANVRVINECQCILGEVRDHRGMTGEDFSPYVIRITGNCILGGLELK